VLNSFSKSWGIAALRIGCLFTNSKIAKVIAHQNVMFNINSIALEIAQNCIDNDGYRKSEFTLIHNHLDIIRKAIVDMPNFELIANSNINLFCLKHHNIPELYKKLLDLGLKTKSLDRMPGMIDSGYCRILIPRDIKDVELLLKILSSIA
jgi:histidinol-phosphate aminotransferase